MQVTVKERGSSGADLSTSDALVAYCGELSGTLLK